MLTGLVYAKRADTLSRASLSLSVFMYLSAKETFSLRDEKSYAKIVINKQQTKRNKTEKEDSNKHIHRRAADTYQSSHIYGKLMYI